MNPENYYVHWSAGKFLKGVIGPFGYFGAQDAVSLVKQHYPNAVCEIRVNREDVPPAFADFIETLEMPA